MPFRQHIKTSIIGTFGAASDSVQEGWTISLKWSPVQPGATIADIGQAQSDGVAESIIPAVAGFFGGAQFHNNVAVVECRSYVIGPDGKAQGSIGYAFPDAPIRGSASSGYKPWQVSTVVSLVAEGRGKGKFGRVYLPPPTVNLQPDGRIQATDATAILNGFRSMVSAMDTALATALTSDVQLVVAGTTGSGTLRPVREMRVGRVLDTQRRRRRSQDEGYSVVSYGV